MSTKNFVSVVSFLFLIIGVVHALRLLQGWPVAVGSFTVPVWVSGVALLVAFYLAWSGYKISKRM